MMKIGRSIFSALLLPIISGILSFLNGIVITGAPLRSIPRKLKFATLKLFYSLTYETKSGVSLGISFDLTKKQ